MWSREIAGVLSTDTPGYSSASMFGFGLEESLRKEGILPKQPDYWC